MTIENLMNRPRLYAINDGVMEFTLGLSTLVSGSGWLVLSLLHPGSPEAINFMWVAQALGLCSSLGFAWGIRTLKNRITFPRGGYVSLAEQGSRRRLVLILVSLFLVFVVWYAARRRVLFHSPSLLAAWFPWFIAGIYAVIGIRYRFAYMLWISLFSALAGTWILVSTPARNATPMGLVTEGAILTLAGAVNLIRWMRSHPKPTETEE